MKIKIIFLLFFVSYYGYSQSKGLVNYGYIESLQEGNAKGADSNAYLIFNKEQSYYVTAKDSLENAENKKDKFIANETGGGTFSLGGLNVR